ncbi:hypothetical protein [Janthinobacterium sp. BJB401]|uniref:hypothetical protein n=1 Tax=Janthinobacterium sp. BJB401 TaxID=2745934 RepID=UPI0015951B8C|nr:hypothetical protein [Janthinobacterium sp. BJB401]NVI84059.1 hypothetical protein [Janthinobacterium sp. BJB401]
MPYEITSLLLKCESDDFSFLVKQIGSHINFTSDSELKSLLSDYVTYPSVGIKTRLCCCIEREIRYLGSSDMAYAIRKLRYHEEPAGVSIHEVIEDVSSRLKVKQKPLGSPESKVERLVKWAAEKTFFAMTPEQQRDMFDKAKINKEQQNKFFDKIKENKTRFLPFLLSVLGPEITGTIVVGLGTAALATFLGKKAAEELIKHIITKFPLWAEWLGPVVWGLSIGWLAYDLQGAAMRKTVPLLLYLGIVGLRDGPEDGEAFWAEPSNE